MAWSASGAVNREREVVFLVFLGPKPRGCSRCRIVHEFESMYMMSPFEDCTYRGHSNDRHCYMDFIHIQTFLISHQWGAKQPHDVRIS